MYEARFAPSHVQNLAFTLVKFYTVVMVVQFCSLSISLLKAALPSRESIVSLNLVMATLALGVQSLKCMILVFL